MKASFFKRICAYFIDYFIVSFLLSLVTIGFTIDSKLTKEVNDLVESYANEEITTNEYNDKASELNYKLQKNNIAINGVSVALMLGYYIIFAYLNKGQTIGKKVFKIRVVEKDKSPSFKSVFIRSLFIYGIISGLYSVICINFLNKEYFSYGSIIINYIESFFIIISFFMILYKKDGKGLHDVIAYTNVIEEVK